MTNAYFSVSSDLVVTGKAMPYDLYINSSGVPGRERFVRVFPRGQVLATDDLAAFKRKYLQLYVRESQRALYLGSLCELPGVADRDKGALLKTSAIRHLEAIFEKDLTSDVLSRTVAGCRDVVTTLVDVLGNYRIDNLRALIADLSFHDFYTYDHSVNVAMYSILIYRSLHPGAAKAEIVQAGMCGLLHDIGKVRIPTRILNNAGALSEEDVREIRKHPDYGRTLLDQEQVRLPRGIRRAELARVVHEHHESFDGTGYPRGLAGPEIHVLARIVAVADFFDALTTKRSYQDPIPAEAALALMRRAAGARLDPGIFEIFARDAGRPSRRSVWKRELVPDFDPCQPHADLSSFFREARPADKGPGYGQIKIVGKAEELEEWAEHGKIRPILEVKKAA